VASRRTIINQAARRYGISPSILYGVWGAESNFGRNRGSSSAGARGDFQFMPGTARSLGVRIGDFRSEAFGAAKYLSQYRSRGRAGMLAAYNAGPAGNPHNPETQAYIPKVLAYARTYKGGGGGGACGPRRVRRRAGRAGSRCSSWPGAASGTCRRARRGSCRCCRR
jgi:soluble lytic murein transglycosylase-like protein